MSPLFLPTGILFFPVKRTPRISRRRAWDESSFFTDRYFVFSSKEDPKDKGPGPGLGVLEKVVIGGV